MKEFCSEDFQIILFNGNNKTEIYTLKELLPLSFSLNN